MQKREIRLSAIFLGVIVVLAAFTMLSLVGVAVYLPQASENPQPLSNNILVIVGFGAVIIFSIAFFVAAWLASYFSDASYYLGRLAHALGTWALLTFFLSFLSIAAIGILEFRQEFSAISNPYISTDVEILDLRAITRLILPAKKEERTQIIDETSRSKNTVAWASSISVIVGLALSCVAAALPGPRRSA